MPQGLEGVCVPVIYVGKRKKVLQLYTCGGRKIRRNGLAFIINLVDSRHILVY